jgi:hypothetical protein
MKPQMQTKFGRGEGNCTSACIASILELETEDVPNFALAGYDWVEACQKWLNERGWQMIQLRFENGDQLAHTWFTPGIYTIMGGVSPRSTKDDVFHHAVVGLTDCWGVWIEHDPHPSNDGIILSKEIWVDLIVPLQPKAVDGNAVLIDFLQRVKERAERTIEETNVVTGAHWLALKQVANEMGVKTDI